MKYTLMKLSLILIMIMSLIFNSCNTEYQLQDNQTHFDSDCITDMICDTNHCFIIEYCDPDCYDYEALRIDHQNLLCSEEIWWNIVDLYRFLLEEKSFTDAWFEAQKQLNDNFVIENDSTINQVKKIKAF